MAIDKNAIGSDQPGGVVGKFKHRHERDAQFEAVRSPIVNPTLDQQITVGLPVSKDFMADAVEQAENPGTALGDGLSPDQLRVIGKAKDAAIGVEMVGERGRVHAVDGGEELLKPAGVRAGFRRCGHPDFPKSVVDDTTYNIWMSDKKDKLSRRELFGRVTGRSRSEARAEQAPDEHPAAQRADDLLRQGDYQKASELYARLLMREPDFLQGYRRLGWCYLKLEQTAEARRVLEDLLERQGDDATGLLYVGLSHAMDGAADNAVTVWRDVHNYNHIVVQREVNFILFQSDSGETPSAEDLVERIEKAIAEQNRMPGSEGAYF